jgi:hypothetical protein
VEEDFRVVALDFLDEIERCIGCEDTRFAIDCLFHDCLLQDNASSP